MINLLPTPTITEIPTAVVTTNRYAPVTKRAQADLPGLDIQVTAVDSVESLQAWIPAWNRLVEVSLESNAFYEPSLLLPALRHLNSSSQVRVLLAWSTPRVFPEGPKVLCGVLPVIPGNETTRWGTRLGCGGHTAWQHPHCYLSMPLLREDVAVETLRAFWQFAGTDLKALWLTMPCVPAEGPFQHVLTQFLQETESSFCVRSLHRRALFQPSHSAEAYLSQWSRSRRHTVKRLEKKLKELGNLQVRVLQKEEPIDPWIEQFLALESSGWKGQAGSALAAQAHDHAFVAEMLRTRWQSNGVGFLSLEIDGKPIAMKCNLLSGTNAFAWKIAYDEAYHKYSPGNVLEKVMIEKLHQESTTEWMDSCAAPNHPMIDGLWHDRRLLQSISIGTPRRGAPFGIACLPLLRWTQRAVAQCLRRSKPNQNFAPKVEEEA